MARTKKEKKLPENYFVFFKQFINLWWKTIFFFNISEDNWLHFKDYDPKEIAREKKEYDL